MPASRRTKVGAKWPGLYERLNRQSERVIECDYYDHEGRRRWHTFPPGTSLKAAAAGRERLRVKRATGERFAPAKAPTVRETWERWLDEAAVSLRPRTVSAYRMAFAHRIVPRIGARRVNVLDRRDVLGLIRDLQRGGLAPWTVRGTLGPLGRFLTWCEDEGLRSGNPVRELRRGDLPRVGRKPHRNLTGADLWRLVEAAEPERRAFVGLLAFAGLRVSEALGLSWADVDTEARVLRVRWQLERDTLRRVEPKTGRAVREIELDEGLLSILREWRLRSRASAPSDFVVVTGAGTPLDHRAAGRRLERVVKAAGLKLDGETKITPHQLRYTFGSLLLEAGVPVSRVSRLMGHANEAITLGVYAHEIERHENAERTRESMRTAFAPGTNLERRGEETRVTAAAAAGAKVASFRGIGDG